jgi:hypothetical protein
MRTKLSLIALAMIAMGVAGPLSGCIWVRTPIKVQAASRPARPGSSETTAQARAREAASLEQGASAAARTKASQVTGRAFFTTKARKVRVAADGGGIRYARVEVWAPGVQEAQFVLRQDGGAWAVLGYAVNLSSARPAYGVPAPVWRSLLD